MIVGERSFEVDLLSRIAMGAVSLALVGLGVAGMIVGGHADFPAIVYAMGGVGLLGGGLLGRWVLRAGDRMVAISETGLRFGEEAAQPIAWARIASIAVLPMRPDLEVRDAQSSLLGRISGSLVDRQELLQLILRRVAEQGGEVALPATFVGGRGRDILWSQLGVAALAAGYLAKLNWNVALGLFAHFDATVALATIAVIGFAAMKFRAAWRLGGDRSWRFDRTGIFHLSRAAEQQLAWGEISRLEIHFLSGSVLISPPTARIWKHSGETVEIPLLGQDLVTWVRAVRAASGPRWDDAILLDPAPGAAIDWKLRWFGPRFGRKPRERSLPPGASA